MYRDSYQRGMLTVFFSGGSKPLAIWDTFIQSGYINRFLDQEIKSMVLEIGGTNISTTYMVCPKGNQVLGIHMPFMVMIVKNLNKYFSFEVTILDDTGTRRRFRVSNFQSKTQILPLCTVMPIGLSYGWNQIQFNLADFTRRAYNKQFVEVQKLKINANIRLRRIYFAERLMVDDELPPEYKLYFPLQSKPGKIKTANDEKIPKEEKKNSKLNNEIPSVPSTTLKTPIPKSTEQNLLTVSQKISKSISIDSSRPAGDQINQGAILVDSERIEEEKNVFGEDTIALKQLDGGHANLTVEKPPSQITEKTLVIEKESSFKKISSVSQQAENKHEQVGTSKSASNNEQAQEILKPTD